MKSIIGFWSFSGSAVGSIAALRPDFHSHVSPMPIESLAWGMRKILKPAESGEKISYALFAFAALTAKFLVAPCIIMCSYSGGCAMLASHIISLSEGVQS